MRRSAGLPMPWMRNGSAMMSDTGMRGFSALNGSWKTIWMERRAIARVAASMALPRKRSVPEVAGCNPATTLPSVLLPLPLSPTSARVSPSAMAKETSCAALSTRRLPPKKPTPPRSNCTLMRSSATSSAGAFMPTP